MPKVSNESGGQMYLKLRSQALALARDPIAVPAPGHEAPVWGVVMDMGFPNGTATLVALADGSTSLYYSNGGGVIGGQAHEPVRMANAVFIDEANRLHGRLTQSETHPLPAAGQTAFYALTDAGVLGGAAANEDLGKGTHELATLFLAGHGVITQLRLVSEGRVRGT
jgi:hypothetical protein